MEVLFIRWNVAPEIFRIGGFGLRYYSLLFALAFYLGYRLVKGMYEDEGLEPAEVTPLMFYLIGGTIIGARLGQVFFYEFGYFRQHPFEIILPFRIGSKGFEWTGYQGLASHGGAIGILIALALYCHRYHRGFLRTLDKVVVAVALAGFFIRTGNLFNSEIIGKPSGVPWAFVFERVDGLPRHPSQVYEAVAYLLSFFLLWGLYRRLDRSRTSGYLFGWFLVLVFTARFFIEFTKEAQEAFEKALPLNMGQILSLPFIIVGVYFLSRKQNRTATGGNDHKDLYNGTQS